MLAPWKKSYDQPQFSSVTKSCLTLCDAMNCSTPGFFIHHYLLGFPQTHVCWISDANQPSHPLSPFSSWPQFFQWVSSSHQVILEPKKMKSDIVSTFSPSVCHEVIGLDGIILVFWMLSFKPAFSLSSFTFIKRFFSSSSLPAIRVISSAYQRLLIFPPAVLIAACDSSSPAFHMM